MHADEAPSLPSRGDGGNAVTGGEVNLRVLKKLSPHQPGARKLAQRYGESLVCVRHRTDAKGQFRYTTVELFVDKTPVRPRSDKMVQLKLRFDEGALRMLIRAAGGSWDVKSKLWLLPRRTAGALNLLDRVVDT